ncbi:MAG TPA: radical SAM protein [Anaerolineae bacterium]|nr:radical SAM protein [Anaerolineae bacterium]
MLGILPRLPGYTSFRRFGRPRPLPFNLVVSLTYRCNSRCKTCNVWQKSAEELSANEWERVFRAIGSAPYYLTFSGGEPFLRQDIAEIIGAAVRVCRPSIITIPTNALLTNVVPGTVEKILRETEGVDLGINVSLDGIGEEHDAIRGVPGSYDKALDTYRQLRAIENPRLTLGIHTVVSRFNVGRLPQIYAELTGLQPDSLISEVAEQRVELGTMDADITPSPQQYAQVADFLTAQARNRSSAGLATITQAFRAQYYQLAKRILLERRQVIPCYAGFASAHISPDGDVWACCTRAEPLGNLRDTDYDLAPIWLGDRAEAARRSIAAGECYCPMANVSYSNMLLHPPTLLRAARQVLLA